MAGVRCCHRLTALVPEIPVAAQTHELSPTAPMRMAIGADIPPADLAVIRTRGMGAKVAGGIDLAATSADERHAG